jgi:hypothetical protein
MHVPKKLAAALAACAVLAAAAPVAANAATAPMLPTGDPNANLCLSGVADPGPFGPKGPYGPNGPYGANGPLHGQANPIGDAATCGGLLTYVLRGGTLQTFVGASLPAGH